MTFGRSVLVVWMTAFVGVSCQEVRGAGAPAATTTTTSQPETPPLARASAEPQEPLPVTDVPPYLQALAREGELSARDGDRIVSAAPADVAVLRGYPAWHDKGPLSDSGERLTILVAKTRYLASESVRVIHVHEATKAGVQLWVMGPKAIYGEYVDGKLASRAAVAPPEGYDGRVLPSPGVDDNYEVSVHRLAPGTHTIQWRFATLSGPKTLESNVVTVEIR